MCREFWPVDRGLHPGLPVLRIPLLPLHGRFAGHDFQESLTIPGLGPAHLTFADGLLDLILQAKEQDAPYEGLRQFIASWALTNRFPCWTPASLSKPQSWQPFGQRLAGSWSDRDDALVISHHEAVATEGPDCVIVADYVRHIDEFTFSPENLLAHIPRATPSSDALGSEFLWAAQLHGQAQSKADPFSRLMLSVMGLECLAARHRGTWSAEASACITAARDAVSEANLDEHERENLVNRLNTFHPSSIQASMRSLMQEIASLQFTPTNKCPSVSTAVNRIYSLRSNILHGNELSPEQIQALPELASLAQQFLQAALDQRAGSG